MTELLRRTRRVSSEGVELHVVEAGQRGQPPLLLVHGFPDSHDVFTPLIDALGSDFHIATFDLRGVGQSSGPSSPLGYRIEAVLPDFTAVIDAVFGPTTTVHLLAHDWGSVLAFSYVADPILQKRVRSFTSVSGPHLGLLWRANLRHLVSLRPSQMRLGAEQLASSWYAFFFHVPFVPRWLMRNFGPALYARVMRRGGIADGDPYLSISPAELKARVHNGLELYRQNVLRPPRAPQRHAIEVPTTLVLPLRDPFIRPQTYAFLGEYVADLTVHPLPASHWVPRSHPVELATIVRTLAARVDAALPRAARPSP